MQEVSGDHLWPTVQTGFMKGERKRYLSIVLCESRKREIGSQIKLATRGDRFYMADLVSLSSISLFSISLLVELRSKSQIRNFINQNQETKSPRNKSDQTCSKIFFIKFPFTFFRWRPPLFLAKLKYSLLTYRDLSVSFCSFFWNLCLLTGLRFQSWSSRADGEMGFAGEEI